MAGDDLDDIDYGILYALKQDARNTSNAEISDRLGVSASTVGNRIDKLEGLGVITGYHPEIDYERAGFPLTVLLRCTAPVSERKGLTERALAVDGVVNVREMMTGGANVHVLAVGAGKEDISRVEREIDEAGFSVVDEILLQDECCQPSVPFDAGE